MHLQPLYMGFDYFTVEPDVSVSDSLFEQGLCLPSGSNLSIGDQNRVIEILHEIIVD